jgi:transcriptional regulator with XRE-family HTH domain
MTPGQRLRTLREELGWSHDTLARASNTSVDYLLQLEDGRVSDVSIRTWKKIAEALGYTVDDILDPPPKVETIFEEIPPIYQWFTKLVVKLLLLLGTLTFITILTLVLWGIITMLINLIPTLEPLWKNLNKPL